MIKLKFRMVQEIFSIRGLKENPFHSLKNFDCT